MRPALLHGRRTGPRSRSPRSRGIFVVDTDGSNLREVAHYTGTHACYDLEPTWSPDGEAIAFAIVCDGESEGIW